MREFARLRDMLRNRHAGDVATLLTALSLEDQVLVFRVLPRKDAAAVFEYLSHDSKEGLLKAMAQEDVADLLNNMAPDERTLFLEELPAEATRQLLTLLTPAERTVALTPLGYPERSVGRLMAPDYVEVREHWTVREALDYIRTHGQDSETLNVIYVVDDQGTLIDDVRIREFLLAPLDHKVAELMDRRFVALTATDNQEAAVAVFRRYADRRSPSRRMQLRPASRRKIDDRETAGRQSFVEAFAGLDVARRDQERRDIMHTRIVADHQQGRLRGLGLAQYRQDAVAGSVVEAVLEAHDRLARQRLQHPVPGFSCAPGGRDQHAVGDERVPGQVGANPGGVFVTAGSERALMVALTRLGLFGLGMSKQHQAHGRAVACVETASVPIPKFASLSGTPVCELRN